METLSTTEPHYIRCVKPNAVLKPGIFENFNVLNQLRCGVSTISQLLDHAYHFWVKENKTECFFLLELMKNLISWLWWKGVLEAIRISCAGYPTKRTFDEFLDRFGMLAPDVLDGYASFENKTLNVYRGIHISLMSLIPWSPYVYLIWCPTIIYGSSDEKLACITICDRMGLKGYQVSQNHQSFRFSLDFCEFLLRHHEGLLPHRQWSHWCVSPQNHDFFS